MDMPKLSEYGDVRILGCGIDMDDLRSRVLIGRIVIVDENHPEFDNYIQRDSQHPAIVPDPDTFRKLTDDEAAHYLAPFEGHQNPNDVVLYGGNEAKAVLRRYSPNDWFGKHFDEPGQLTTTLYEVSRKHDLAVPGKIKKIGLHMDENEEDDDRLEHRVGYCFEGERDLQVATHSGHELLKGTGIEPDTRVVRGLLYEHPELLGQVSCLAARLTKGYVYDAYTGKVVHDAGNWSQLLRSGVVFAKAK